MGMHLRKGVAGKKLSGGGGTKHKIFFASVCIPLPDGCRARRHARRVTLPTPSDRPDGSGVAVVVCHVNMHFVEVGHVGPLYKFVVAVATCVDTSERFKLHANICGEASARSASPAASCASSPAVLLRRLKD